MLAFLGFSSQAAVQGKGPIECLQAHLADPGHNNSELLLLAARTAPWTSHPYFANFSLTCRLAVSAVCCYRILPGSAAAMLLITQHVPPLTLSSPLHPCRSLHLVCGQRGPGCRAGAVHHPLPDRGQEPPAGHRRGGVPVRRAKCWLHLVHASMCDTCCACFCSRVLGSAVQALLRMC